MPCFHPITAYYSKTLNESGKRSLVFNPKQAQQQDSPIDIGCGQCLGCRLERSRQWAIRCLHEASLHEDNCFITLTFSADQLEFRENKWSLDVKDYQLFMKRLRKQFGPKIRFFHCGEYGDNNGRPHYHACLFNFDFPDKQMYSIKNGNRYYTSEILSKLWPYGFSVIGDVTFASAAYVARYIMKKVTGKMADAYYEYIHEDTGEILQLKPEYTTMSRRPGIAHDWFKKYKTDVYPSDEIIIDGKKVKPPKFYDKLLEKIHPSEYEELKDIRINSLDKNHPDLTVDRMDTRKKCLQLKIKQLVRNHDI